MSVNRQCENCIYADGCEKRGMCSDFIPCDPIDENEFYDELIRRENEGERSRFVEDWLKYIGEYE